MRQPETRQERPFDRPSETEGDRLDASWAPVTWTVVIPAKAPARAKTRLAPHLDDASRMALARAFAADTVAAALAAGSVARVIVVGDDPSLADEAEFLDERALEGSAREGRALDERGLEGRGLEGRASDDRALGERAKPAGAGAGLTAAIARGIAHARGTGGGHVAVLLGDLPCLTPDDLDDALALAAGHPLAFVPDADATGTSLATALADVRFAPRFGPDSAARHRDAGFVPIEASARLRRDVDTLAALEDAIALGTGPNTAHVLANLTDRGNPLTE
ncbi:2-phospho-L-lactate guanylyltransferase [Agromyces aerolatus]|uniref:2-phospho-L-lactate guanylyltransferase n=1 Tax=Agromyces sp. LY-1074 TaxID=3074080 RepID=UPI00286E3C9E|nr:2-phospho-L-lactate guanylyltransferase [Agromyces sp. LY-1074]